MKEVYGLLGYPLVHSFSARYFAEKFRREGIPAEYQNFEYESVSDALDRLRCMPQLRGFNVTIPHKQAVIPHLTALSAEARAIGAVNVVRVRHDERDGVQMFGYNSDVIGFCRSIRPLLQPGVHRRALVLGTGGASKAVVYGLKQLGVEPVYVSRTKAPGRLAYSELTAEVMRDCRVVVNCSPVGMYPHTAECPDIPYHLLTPEHLLYDLVYNPEDTLFMQRGREYGAAVKNGLEMLVLQAEAGWEMWHDNTPFDGE